MEITLDESKECFEKIFYNYITINSAKGVDNINYEGYRKNIEMNSETIARKIGNNTYKFSYLKEKLVLKGRGKEPREILIPTIRDKVLLKYIQLKLQEKFPIAIQKTPQFYINEFKVTAKNGNYNKLIKLDIEKFYNNINHNIIIGKLNEKNMGYIGTLVEQIIKKAGLSESELINKLSRNQLQDRLLGIPQGISISNILSFIYLSELDDFCKNRKNIKYIRYVDDIIIFYNDNDCISEDVIKILGKLKLESNKSKEKPEDLNNDMNINFLGYNYKYIYNKFLGFSIRAENIYKFENSIVDMFIKFDRNKNMSKGEFIFTLNNKITGAISSRIDTDISKERRYGWLFFYSQVDDYSIFHRLDGLVQKRISKLVRKDIFEVDEIKSFRIAFNEIRYNIKNTNYIFKPDSLDYSEKKKILIDTFKLNRDYIQSEKDIDKFYYAYVYKKIKEYEKDFNSIIS